VAYCPFCTQGLPPDSTWCPHCQRSVSDDPFETPEADAAASAAASAGGIYTLDNAARCPYCRKAIDTVHVVRLTRTQVAFTSTLPRSGRALTCPNCAHILSVELAGLP
jgi:hypothetical protein